MIINYIDILRGYTVELNCCQNCGIVQLVVASNEKAINRQIIYANYST